MSEESPPDPSPPDRLPERLALYVPRVLHEHLVDAPAEPAWTTEGTAVFADISGFTRLSEQLAKRGREGAEQITEVIGTRFEAILAVAYDRGGTLLKFGGDALLLWFAGDGHVERACRAAVAMRAELRGAGLVALPGAEVTLQISQGIHTGRFDFYAVGSTHVECLTAGPAWTRLVAMEQAAAADEILASESTAAALPDGATTSVHARGLLVEAMPGVAERMPRRPRPALATATLARCLPAAVRAHVVAGGGASEHRPVTVAFLRFAGVDAIVATRGVAAAAEALAGLIAEVDAAAQAWDVALLASDVDADGGKLILAAGAPKVTGDDEERMLLALRRILDAGLALELRIGVHRGAVFAGDIGTDYRRTYTVMGDVVNLAARIMAHAPAGALHATPDVLDRSNTLFATEDIEPFPVKGKADPVVVRAVGRAIGSRARQASLQRLPLTGRNAELGLARKALASVRAGSGALVVVSGEAGIGKTRFLEALRDAAMGYRKLHATCEAYTMSTPYAAWRELMRPLLETGRDDPDSVVEAKLRVAVAASAPDLAPWLPLVAAAFDVTLPPTPEVAMLAEGNRRARLHESVARFLDALLPGPALLEFENAHHMDEASAQLLEHLAAGVAQRRWLVAVARRPAATGFEPSPDSAAARIELKPLARPDAQRMAELATQSQPLPAHVVEVVAQRSGGNPQFLRELVRSAVESGGIVGLPDTAEAAAMARIDALAPEDRALVRRAAVFGMAFHRRMLAWFDDAEDGPPPGDDAWSRLADLFDDDGNGYLRFRQSLLRDTAYEGLPFRQRRRLHATVAGRLETESADPEEEAGVLSMHWFVAGDPAQARRYASIAARRAEEVYAYVEAAGFHARAIEAGRQIAALPAPDLARSHEAAADAWNRAGEYRKAADAYTEAHRLSAGDPIAEARLLLKQSWLEEKLGRYPEALRWLDRTREALASADGPEAAQLGARTSAWTATILQAQGNTSEALSWAERTMQEARDADDAEALGAAYFVLGWAYGILGRRGGEDMLKNAVDAYARSGNRARQAATLSNLGVVCQWEGRWDDALAYYERGREESLKIGNRVDAAVSRINVAEILIDRGDVPEAEAMLQQTMPLWQSSEYRYFLGACLWMLGRASLRAQRVDEALERLAAARDHLTHVGAAQEALDVDARVAECRVRKGDAEGALELADTLLAGDAAAEGLARLRPVLERVRAHARLLQGDPYAAREALEAGLAAARERNDLFEIALTLPWLIELDRLEGVEATAEIVEESRALVTRLKVRALPPIPAFG